MAGKIEEYFLASGRVMKEDSSVVNWANRLDGVLIDEGGGSYRAKVQVDVDTVTLNNVDVDNFPTEYPLPAAQALDLKSVSAAQDGSWSVSIDNFPTTQTIDGTVSVDNIPTDYATSAKQLADNHQVTVSNQIAQPLTDAELRAEAVDVRDGALVLFTDYQTSLADGAELDSGWLPLGTWDRYQFTSKSDVAGLTQIIESSPIFPATAGSTLTTTNTIDRTFNYFAVGAREEYMRFRWKNETGVTVDNVSLTIKGIKAEGQSVLALSQAPSDFSLSTLQQSIIYGFNESTLGREQVKLSGNNNLLVAVSDRISQTNGRVHHEVNVIGVTTGSQYTVPVGFDFYVTSIEWAGASTSTSAPVRARVRDGGAAGVMKYSFAINEPTAFAQQAGNGGQTYPEPTLFETSVYFELVSGAFTGDLLIVGYLEPV